MSSSQAPCDVVSERVALIAAKIARLYAGDDDTEGTQAEKGHNIIGHECITMDDRQHAEVDLPTFLALCPLPFS
jgi:hypothetical protein